ncbi:MAG: sulfotransferase family protein [Actinobacteria bacterium]|nr:sulfotransferase family protein [Actinomycetota bacterium]MDP7549780.1 hypothetical protein [Acidimicrobiales bacterium]MBT3687446.1 sulfotransferase family protein [Actinomycetota bacterium]MBT4038258.1 sulfotransferase family protein [Actinomycetota bacterium]MBT4279149.1 sulfotransferase family protein [Actinomycetota bacterium]
MTLRINCWSGPRNISTALMYSFRQRTDTVVFDEPIYAHYLRVSGREHPGRVETLANQDPDGNAVVRDLILGPHPRPIAFFKMMSHHLIDLETAFLRECRNVLLIRDPRHVLRSLSVNIPDVNLGDTGLESQVELLDSILGEGDDPIVVDSAALLADPAAMLRKMCSMLDVDFEDAMLSWPSGPKPEDGTWAVHWYANAHASTGFLAGIPSDDPIPTGLEPVLEAARPLYDRLLEHSLSV